MFLFTNDIENFFSLLKKLKEEKLNTDVKCFNSSSGYHSIMYTVIMDCEFYQMPPELASHLIKHEKNVKSLINHYERKAADIKRDAIKMFSIYYNFYVKKHKDLAQFCDDFKFRLDCDCFDKKIIYELFVNYNDWFKAAFDVYYRLCMCSEQNRLDSFNHPKFVLRQQLPKDFAKYGLYYLGSYDWVRCFDCDIQLGQFGKTDNVLTNHLKKSPNCYLLNNQPTHNICIKNRKSLNYITDAEKIKAISLN